MSGLPTPVDPSDPRAGLADVTGQWTEMHNRCHDLVAELLRERNPATTRPAGDDTAPPAGRVSLNDMAPARRQRIVAAALHRQQMQQVHREVELGIPTSLHEDVQPPWRCLGCLVAADVALRAAAAVDTALSGAAADPRAGDTGAEQQPGAFYELAVLDRFARGGQADMETVRHQVGALVAAQRREAPLADEGVERETPARAGDTAPDDAADPAPGARRELHDLARRTWVGHAEDDCELLDLLDTAVAAVLDRTDAETARLRSEAAALRAAGDELAQAAAAHVAYTSTDSGRERLREELLGHVRAWDVAWRSAAGSPTTAPTAHRPDRDGDIAAWLRQHRERHDFTAGNGVNAYTAIDDVLNDYRLHADTGTPLAESAETGSGDETCGCGRRDGDTT